MSKFFFSFLLLCSQFSQAQNMNQVIPSAHFKRVITIIFENEEFRAVKKDSYFKSLASQGVTLTSMSGVSRPSQPNYISMISGDTFGVKSDKNVDLNEKHIGNLLENKNLTWKVYAENYPENCFLEDKSGKYARKHVPFLSFTNVSKTSKCQNIESEKNFMTDWKNNQLGHYTMYIPNLNNDGHDTGIKYSSDWLKKTFDTAFKNPQFMKDTLVVITYDEGRYLISQNHIYTTLLGPMIKAGTEISEDHNHYSILKMIEREWALGSLGKKDATASDIKNIWK